MPLLPVVIALFLLGLSVSNGHAQLGAPPQLTVQPLGISVSPGGTAIITATSTSLTKAKFYWFHDGQPLSNPNALALNLSVPLVGTVSTLTIVSTSTSDAGVYTLRITNAVGSAVSSNAALIVLTTVVSNVVSIVSTGAVMTLNGFSLQLSGPPGSNLVVQASADLQTWSPISTNSNPSGSVTFVDTNAISRPARFYRAKIQ